MDDTVGPVRDATAEALGTLLKVIGERPLNPYIEQLDKIKMDKVTDMICCFLARELYPCALDVPCHSMVLFFVLFVSNNFFCVFFLSSLQLFD